MLRCINVWQRFYGVPTSVLELADSSDFMRISRQPISNMLIFTCQSADYYSRAMANW